MPRLTRLLLACAAVFGVLAASGCSASPDTYSLSICVETPDGAESAALVVRQDDAVAITAELVPGAVSTFRLPIAPTEVTVDGEAFGAVGVTADDADPAAGPVYLRAEGCPTDPDAAPGDAA